MTIPVPAARASCGLHPGPDACHFTVALMTDANGRAGWSGDSLPMPVATPDDPGLSFLGKDAMADIAERWRIGNVTITRIVEAEQEGVPPSAIFQDLSEQDVRALSWLRPHYSGADGRLRLSNHSFVIESCGRRIMVDTCVGNDKDRAADMFHRLDTPFLERMAAAGFAPDTIDYVLCTHMHVDHVGWNTRRDGRQWVPTFPNARYLFGRVEWDHCRQEAIETGDVPAGMAAMLQPEAVIADSIRPIVDAGLADFVETDHRVTEEVALFPTPGHTPGHVSVRIASAGYSAVITGDVIHHPVQFARPAISATVDHDRERARATRRSLIEDNADQDVILLGTHFAGASGGRVVRDGAGWRFLPCRDGAGAPGDDPLPDHPVV